MSLVPLPRDLPRLRTLESYLLARLADVHAAIALAEERAKHVQRPTAGAPAGRRPKPSA